MFSIVITSRILCRLINIKERRNVFQNLGKQNKKKKKIDPIILFCTPGPGIP